MTLAHRLGTINASLETDARARAFASYAKFLMLGKGSMADSIDRAERANAKNVARIIKAIAGGTTTDPDYSALAEFSQMTEAWIGTLSAHGAFDGLLPDMLPGLLHSKFGILTAHADADEVIEGKAKMVASVNVTGQSLAERRVAAIVALSNDLLARGKGVEALLGKSLSNAVSKASDEIFIAALVAVNSPIPSSALDAAGVLHELRALVDAVGADATSSLHLVMSGRPAGRLATMPTTDGAIAFPGMTVNGGQISNIPAHTSDAAGTSVILADASGIVGASDQIELRVSRTADLEMSAPTTSMISDGASPPAPVGASMISLFQSNSTALRAERLIGFTVIRDSAIASLSGVAWGETGSPPA